MKHYKWMIFVMLLAANLSGVFGQVMDTAATKQVEEKYYVIQKNDGSEYLGKIISSDEREVLIETKEMGRLYIPKHEIQKIAEIKPSEIKEGVYKGSETFSTRYFITTNGLPIEKGDNYVLINWYGPDAQFALNNNFSLGVMTTWIGIPIIGSIKKSFILGEKTSMALGSLVGTASWAQLDAVGILGYGSFTYGDRKANFTVSGGGAALTDGSESYQAGLLSFATLFKINSKVTFIGDSFIIIGENSGALIIPGLRFSSRPNRAFQFGVAAFATEGELIPVPVPVLGWFMKL